MTCGDGFHKKRNTLISLGQQVQLSMGVSTHWNSYMVSPLITPTPITLTWDGSSQVTLKISHTVGLMGLNAWGCFVHIFCSHILFPSVTLLTLAPLWPQLYLYLSLTTARWSFILSPFHRAGKSCQSTLKQLSICYVSEQIPFNQVGKNSTVSLKSGWFYSVVYGQYRNIPLSK